MKRRACAGGAIVWLFGAAFATISTGLVSPGDAHASGLFFADRGVRPLARGGAFVAGADDLGAIAYNPAGIYDAGSQFFLDASWVNFSSDYTRQSLLRQIDPNTGQTVATYERTFEPVEGTTPFVPIPTLAASFSPHRQWMLAFGIHAPYAALTTYPEEVNGEPAPQRYSLITLDGSLLGVFGAYVAFAPVEELRIGLGFEILAGTFNSVVNFSGCIPERFLCAPEQPEWDVLAELTAGPIVAPSGNVGVIWEFIKNWRAGASFHLPYWIRTDATIATRLPSAAPFSGATQNGDEATVSFDIPWNIRAGLESRDLTPGLRVEVALLYEHWSMLDKFDIDPEGVSLDNVASFPDQYFLPSVEIPRNFQDSVGVKLGGEYTFPVSSQKLTVRAGLAYDTSAVPEADLTVLAVDMQKVTTALGLGVHIEERWRLDATYAHVFGIDVEVAPEDARAPQISPVQANPPREPNYVNGGLYEARANVVGLGITYNFEPPPKPTDPEPAKPPPKKKPPEKEPPEKEKDSEVSPDET